MMKKMFAILSCLVLALGLAACGSTADSTVSGQPAESASQPAESASQPAEDAEPQVQIGNPYVTCADAAEMEQQAGLEVSLPAQLPSWVSETIYRAMPGKLVEVIYQGQDNEIRVRIANGDEDISGVYGGEYTTSKEILLGDVTVHAQGTESAEGELLLFMNTWTANGRTYSVTSTAGVPEAEMLQILEEIQ